MSPEPKPLKSNLKEGTEFLEECYPNLVGDKPNSTNYVVMDTEATLLHISQNLKYTIPALLKWGLSNLKKQTKNKM